jgi:hypothetical protein
MLYLLLTGQLPFTGDDMTVLQKLVNEPHPPLHTLLATYPPALDGIVDRALAKDPDHRYATAEEFAADLHALGEELKKGQVAELFNDAERLTAEQQFGRAREVLLQLVRIDPQHTGARQLLGIVQQNLALLQRAEQIRQLIAEAEEAAASDRYVEALASLDQALQLDPNHEEAKSRLQSVKEKKQRYDELTALITQADSLRERGDWTGALKVAERALQLGQQDTKVRALYSEISRQAKLAAQQNQIRELMGKARIEVSARRFTEAMEILREVSKLDPSLPEMESLLQTAVAGQEQERRRKLIEQIQAEIERCLAAEEYDRATELIDRAVEQLPSESSLLQLKTRVALVTRQFRARQLVDTTAAKAQAAFQQSPGEALLIVQKALQELPGEERLLALEDSLRQRLKAREKEEVRGRYLREAQDAINAGRFDKAVEILESYQLEFADAAGVGELMEFASNELTQQRRRERCAHCIAEARSLMEQERFDQAVQLLGPACAETGDPVLARLLEEARAHQEETERKTIALMARIGRLREQGQLDEAIEILKGLPASSIAGSPQKALLEEIRSEHERLRAEQSRKQTIADTLAKAAKIAEQGQFQSALEALESVRRAWGEAPELARAISEIEARRGRAANEAVGKAVENARAALLANDTARALEELRKGAELFEFAGAAQQSDWRRLNAEASKAPTRRSTGHVPVVGEVAEEAPKRKLLIPVIAGGVLVAAVAAAGVWFHFQGAQPNANHNHTIPGPNPTPTPLPVPPTGTLLLKGNTDNVEVFVDGVLKGFTLADGTLKLPLDPGQHSIRLTKSGYTEIPSDSLTISANNQSDLPFKLTPSVAPAPAQQLAFMAIQSTPGASVSIDNAPQGQTDARGSLIVQVKPGERSLTISLSGYQPFNQTFNLKNGERENVSAMLSQIPRPPTPTPTPVQPVSALFSASATTIEQGQSTTLTWETANASEVSIDNGVGQVSASGQRQMSPTSNTTYQLVAKGNGGTQQRTVSIVVEPKQVAVVPTPAPTPAPTPQPVDQTALLQAVINNFNAALAAHDVGRMRSEWAGMTPQVEKKWQSFFKSLPKARVSESCPAGALNVSGDSATWSCTITTLIPGAPAQPQGIRFTLAKRNDAWVITDWR